MRRSTTRRAATRPRFDRRLLGAAAAVVVFGGLIGVTQISSADDSSGPEKVNGLEILANDCGQTTLAPHDGFQNGNRCVSTEFGEVGAAEKNPTLLITEAPRSVRTGEPFQLKVSTRNLVRDRFLAAGQGGYYVESSVLTAEGLVRGHFHTACRMLSSTSEAVDPAPVPAFFVATEDRKGGAQPDTVTIQVPGMPDAGVAQCASWAGDGSHRVPMMQRANQTPAFDAVRIRVEGAAGGDDGGNENPPPGDDNGGNENPPPGDNDGGDGNENPPPADNDGNENPPPADNDGDNGGDGDQNENPPPAQGGDGDGDEQPAPVVTQPTTKTTTKVTPAKPKPTATKATKAAEPPAQPAGQDEAEAPAEETAEAKPKPSATAKKGAVSKQSDDEDADDAEAAPAAELQAQDEEVVAEPAPAPADENSRLALTGVNTFAIAGGGLLLVLVGAVLFNSVRRRRAGAGWR